MRSLYTVTHGRRVYRHFIITSAEGVVFVDILHNL